MLPSYAGYADLADLALVGSGNRPCDDYLGKPAEAGRIPGVAAGKARFYVTAKVTTCSRAVTACRPIVSYLADVPLDAQGRPREVEKGAGDAVAAPVAGRPGELRLIAPDAQIGDPPEVERGCARS